MILRLYAILLFTLIPNVLPCQSTDSITVPKLQYIKGAQTIKLLQDSVSILNTELTIIKNQLDIIRKLRMQDQEARALLDSERQVYRGLIEHYQKSVQIIQPKWYEDKLIWFIGGIATTYMASVIVRNVK